MSCDFLKNGSDRIVALEAAGLGTGNDPYQILEGNKFSTSTLSALGGILTISLFDTGDIVRSTAQFKDLFDHINDIDS